MIALLQNKTNEENKELEKLRKDVVELQKSAERNWHWLLLKYWLIQILYLGFVPIGLLVIGIIAHFVTLPITLPSPIEPSRIEAIAIVVFNATVTINALFIGFVPLISFFFVREIREREHGLEQNWEKELKEIKGEKLKLTNAYYNLFLMTMHNIRSGVLRYTRTYVTISVFLQFILIFFYILTIGYEIAGLCIMIIVSILYIIVAGLLPLVGLALYEPALKFVRYIVGEEVIRIEFES